MWKCHLIEIYKYELIKIPSILPTMFISIEYLDTSVKINIIYQEKTFVITDKLLPAIPQRTGCSAKSPMGGPMGVNLPAKFDSTCARIHVFYAFNEISRSLGLEGRTRRI